jgi:hypothetical protein
MAIDLISAAFEPRKGEGWVKISKLTELDLFENKYVLVYSGNFINYPSAEAHLNGLRKVESPDLDDLWLKAGGGSVLSEIEMGIKNETLFTFRIDDFVKIFGRPPWSRR